MSPYTKHCTLSARLVVVGFGSVAQGVMPLVLRHINVDTRNIVIVAADGRGRAEADQLGIRFIQQPLTPANYRAVLDPLLSRGDFLLNVSVDVSSLALVELCAQRGATYLDTSIEPWAGAYTDVSVSPSLRTNHALRESALALRKRYREGPTAVLTHGANPGLVSHLVKQALLNIASDTGRSAAPPTTRGGWARLARDLAIKVIQISERDSQTASRRKRRGEFVNTWSIDGFCSEAAQPAELGWGSHERSMPPHGARHELDGAAAIYLLRPGASQLVRSWAPEEGSFQGLLLAHNESISIPDYLTVKDGNTVSYRPTCYYAYHPCDDAVNSIYELVGKEFTLPREQRLLRDEIIDGRDELGVLLAGHERGAYWHGSKLDIHTARELAPYNSATSLQVGASVLAGMVWAIENPNRGIVEPEEMDFRRCLDICKPYLGPLVGVYSDWNPLRDRSNLFPEDLDHSDPWQFKNFLAS